MEEISALLLALENTNFNSEARVTAPEGFDPDKLINKKAVELVNLYPRHTFI